MMACIISFSGVGGSYIQAHATSVGIPRPGAWNDDASVWENIYKYLSLYMSYMGVYVNPSGLKYTAQDFYDFMTSNDVSHDVAHGIFCDCDDSTHTSFSGNEHGGGGFVRDGITQDEDGNVTYSDEISDLFHDYILHSLETNCGYFVFNSFDVDDIPVTIFPTEEDWNLCKEMIRGLDMVHATLHSYQNSVDVCFRYIPTTNIFHASATAADFLTMRGFAVIDDNWSKYYPQVMTYDGESSFLMSSIDRPLTFDDFVLRYNSNDLRFFSLSSDYLSTIITTDGRPIKVWKSMDSFKLYDVGQQPYYVTQNWLNYNSADDNSITLTQQEFQYYTDNSTTIFQTIQNNIDNSGDSDLTEKDVQDIVDDAVQDILDELKNNNSGNGSNSDNDSGSGGTGVGDLIDGIGKIFDTILSLIGKLMGVVADFTQSILDLFSGFTTFTDGFSDFLAGAFSFIPAEVWDIIKVGLSLMVLLAVIKFLRK